MSFLNPSHLHPAGSDDDAIWLSGGGAAPVPTDRTLSVDSVQSGPSIGSVFVGSVLQAESFGGEQFGASEIQNVFPVFNVAWPKQQDWKLYLALSNQIKRGASQRPNVIAELDYAQGFKITYMLSRPGSLSTSMNLDDDRGSLMLPVNTCLIGVRDGRIRWSGPLWTRKIDLPGNNIDLGAVGWLELIEKRKFRRDLKLGKQKDVDRLNAIFAEISSQTDADGKLCPSPIEYDGHIGAEVEWPPITYSRNDTMGATVNQLMEIENGYDIVVDPQTKIMTTHRSQIRGGVYGHGQDRPDCLFSFGLAPHNLKECEEVTDAATLANVINAVGPTGAVVQTDAPNSIAQYGVFEDDFSMTDAGVSTELLKFGAAAEVAFRSQPLKMWKAAPFPWSPDNGVPRIFDDYDIGDIARLAAERSWMKIPHNLHDGYTQPVRIFGATVEVDKHGKEEVSDLLFYAS